jgi:hypothetical protein
MIGGVWGQPTRRFHFRPHSSLLWHAREAWRIQRRSLCSTGWRRRWRLGDTRPRHHRLLLARLEQIAAGATDRLMVLMPPGSAKSTYASVLFPAWWFHRHPRSSVIAASHTADLAAHFCGQVRNLVSEHPALGYKLSADSHAGFRFRTSERGEYYAAGVRGPITGRRADLVLIDDPIKSHAEADSAAHRDALHAWYRSELTTRLKPGGRIVLIMTRWHQDDLGGRLEGEDDWTILRLPALAEDCDPLVRAPGEALWPEWENAAALERKRSAVGPRVWSALFQQSPRPDIGALFRVARIEIIETAPAEIRSVRAWDLAATAAGHGRDPDWTVGLLLGAASGRLVVQDIVRLHGGPHEVAEAIVATARTRSPHMNLAAIFALLIQTGACATNEFHGSDGSALSVMVCPMMQAPAAHAPDAEAPKKEERKA